jgi:hypothetical protein
MAYILFEHKTTPASSSGVPRGETRCGGRGPLQAVAAPLTPRPRGTIYEALPLFFYVFEKAADGCTSNSSDAIITVQQESEPA